MERYKLIKENKAEGTVVLMDTKGRYTKMDEGYFRDNFVKLKDAAIRFIKKGGKILAEWRDKILDGINSVFSVVANKQAIVVLSEENAAIAASVGVAYDESRFDTYCEDKSKEEGKESPNILLDAIIEFGEFLRYKGVLNEEVREAKPGAYDEYRGMAGSRIQSPNDRRTINTDGFRDNAQRFGKPGVKAPQLRSQIPFIADYDRESLLKVLDRKLRRIFRNEITEDSSVKFDEETYKPLFIFGAAGIGKTSIIKELANKYGVDKVLLVGSDMNKYSISSPTNGATEFDIKDDDGNVIATKERHAMEVTISADIPAFDYDEARRKGLVKEYDAAMGKGIIFIDEFSRIPDKAVINSIMSFATERSVGSYRLGTNWAIVLATNPGGMSKKNKMAQEIMSDFLQDDAKKRRFELVNFTPKFEEWLEWAKGPGKVDPMVIDYLSQPQFMFHWFNSFDLIPSDDSGTTSNPALWTQLSHYIKNLREDYIEEGYDLSKLEDAEQFVEDIRQWFTRNMPYEGDEYTEYAKDVMTRVSPQDYKNAWINPKAIAFTDKETGKSGRKMNKDFGTNGSGLATSPEQIANYLYDACPDKITSQKSAEEFMDHMKENFDNVAEFIDFFYSDGTKLSKINGATSFLPYTPVSEFVAIKAAVVKALARNVITDLSKYTSEKLVNSTVFSNGVFDGSAYPKSEYFEYLLSKAR